MFQRQQCTLGSSGSSANIDKIRPQCSRPSDTKIIPRCTPPNASITILPQYNYGSPIVCRVLRHQTVHVHSPYILASNVASPVRTSGNFYNLKISSCSSTGISFSTSPHSCSCFRLQGNNFRAVCLGVFAKLQKATISFVMSVCPSA